MKSFKDKISDFFFLEEEDSLIDEEVQPSELSETSEAKRPAAVPRIDERQNVRRKNKRNVVNMKQQPARHPKIAVVVPRFETDAENIANLLLDEQSVVLNVRRMDDQHAVKMIDFLQGVTYAISGDIQRIGEEIFICTPHNVDVELSELEVNESNFFRDQT